MAVTIPADVLSQYCRFSLYNSPFVAHDRGCAVDLYPGDETTARTTAPSPVAGEVVDTRTVDAPPKPYAADHDHLTLVDTGDRIARMLHVDPSVGVGDTVAVGDPLGELVRAGFFAPWVPNHIHLGFRTHGDNRYRASGSLPLELGPGVDLRPVDWDGTGTVAAAGETWALLDAPAHPAPGAAFAGVAAGSALEGNAVLDGGCTHYEGGGLLGAVAPDPGSGQSDDSATPVALAGTTVGDASGRHVTWRDLEVRANGDPVTGVALFCGRDRAGVKLVGENVDLPVGRDVRVTVEPAA